MHFVLCIAAGYFIALQVSNAIPRALSSVQYKRESHEQPAYNLLPDEENSIQEWKHSGVDYLYRPIGKTTDDDIAYRPKAEEKRRYRFSDDDLLFPPNIRIGRREYEDKSLKGKRSSATKRGMLNAKVEILIIVDNTLYRRFLKKHKMPDATNQAIREYYAIMFAMMNLRYAAIKDPGLKIDIAISGIVVAEDRMASSWIEYLVKWTTLGGQVQAQASLEKLETWLQEQQDLPKYDHAMAFTAHQLMNGVNKIGVYGMSRASPIAMDTGNKLFVLLMFENDVKQEGFMGMAWVSTICQVDEGYSASVITERGDFHTVAVAAHELAHCLGATHDGSKENADCPGEDNYMMSPGSTMDLSTRRNAYFFSKCSVRQMKAVLSSPQAACVQDHASVHITHDLKDRPPGEIYDLNDQCAMSFGQGSAICGRGDAKICLQLWCTDPKDPLRCRTHSRLSALPGTPCSDNGEVCMLGECVRNSFGSTSSNPENVKDTKTNAGSDTKAHVGGASTGERTISQSNVQYQTSQINAGSCAGGDKNRHYCQSVVKARSTACKVSSLQRYCCRTCQELGY